MTQPALSRSIKLLEDELGQLLFDRSGKKIELTAFGRTVLQRSQALIEEAEALKHSGRALDPSVAGRVRLGLSSGPGVMLSVPVMQHFARHFPQFHVDIVRASTATLVQMLRDRHVDAMVIDVRSMRPSPDLQVTHMGEMQGAFMCRKGHPLAGLSTVTFEQLSQYPVASTPLSDELARILIERHGEKAHPDVMVHYSSDEIADLIEVAEKTDVLLLAIRACAPALTPVQLSPPLDDKARFALVTLANKAEALYLPQIRQVMDQVFL